MRGFRWRADAPRRAFRHLALPVVVVLSIGTAAAQPAFDAVRSAWRSSEASLLDRNGLPLQTLRIDDAVRRLHWVPLRDVSPAFRAALLRSEDRRFLEHSGIDWRAVGGALVQATGGNGRPPRGASTITMQLAGLLSAPQRGGRRTLPQKFHQAVGALALERAWSKDQILEAYLNLAGFRGELVGIAALAELLFGKTAAALNDQESAIAAALLRGPNAAPAVVARRACLLLHDTLLERPCDGLESLAITAFARSTAVSPLSPALAPHLARRLLAEPGQVVRSTVDARIQRLARTVLARQVRELGARNVHDGAVLVLDNASGEVLAWVGASGPASEAPQVDAVVAPRQAGSTLKPFLYAQALAERRLTAASLLDDTPLDLQVSGGLYGPQNYDRDFKGPVSVRTALASSLNVPAVRALTLVTPVGFAPTLRRLGLRTVDRSGDHYGFSLALGAAEVTLLDLTNAYRALANGGLATPVRLRTDAPATGTPVRALDRASAFVIADILSDRNARALAFGWDSPLALPVWSAVKTGTSKDMRDNWCIGFSRRYTVGVWIGNAAGSPMWKVSGVTGAAPVWGLLMQALEGGAGFGLAVSPSGPPPPPAGLVRVPVRFGDRLEPDRQEWFLAGTEQRTVMPAALVGTPRIIAPVESTIVAIDPDIPPSAQRVRLAADGKDTPVRWLLDGREISRQHRAAWFPMPGRHRLELRGTRGEVFDSVTIEVRGARLGRPVDRPRSG